MDNLRSISVSYKDFPINEINLYGRPKNWLMAIHKHDYYQVFYVIKGRVQVDTDEGADILTPGMLSIIPAGFLHSLKTIEGYWQVGININPKREDACGINSLLVKTITKPIIMKMPRFMQQIDEIIELFSSNSLLSIAKVRQKLYNMVLDCIDEYWFKKSNSFENQLSNYLYSNVGINIKTSEVAEYFNMSVAQLERKTQKFFGCGVIELFKLYRLSKAKIMLRDTNYPISVVAEKIGCYDASHFSAFIKRETGLSPLKFRELTGKVQEYSETEFVISNEENNHPIREKYNLDKTGDVS